MPASRRAASAASNRCHLGCDRRRILGRREVRPGAGEPGQPRVEQVPRRVRRALGRDAAAAHPAVDPEVDPGEPSRDAARGRATAGCGVHRRPAARAPPPEDVRQRGDGRVVGRDHVEIGRERRLEHRRRDRVQDEDPLRRRRHPAGRAPRRAWRRRGGRRRRARAARAAATRPWPYPSALTTTPRASPAGRMPRSVRALAARTPRSTSSQARRGSGGRPGGGKALLDEAPARPAHCSIVIACLTLRRRPDRQRLLSHRKRLLCRAIRGGERPPVTPGRSSERSSGRVVRRPVADRQSEGVSLGH